MGFDGFLWVRLVLVLYFGESNVWGVLVVIMLDCGGSL